jgi:hypothetical protein
MFTSRSLARSSRVLRKAPLRANLRHVRPQSTSTATKGEAVAAGGSSGLVGGLAGGALVFAVSPLWKSYFSSSKLN